MENSSTCKNKTMSPAKSHMQKSINQNLASFFDCHAKQTMQVRVSSFLSLSLKFMLPGKVGNLQIPGILELSQVFQSRQATDLGRFANQQASKAMVACLELQVHLLIHGDQEVPRDCFLSPFPFDGVGSLDDSHEHSTKGNPAVTNGARKAAMAQVIYSMHGASMMQRKALQKKTGPMKMASKSHNGLVWKNMVQNASIGMEFLQLIFSSRQS